MHSLTIHLIRHGKTVANSEGLYIGKTDVALTLEGADELEKLAAEGIYPTVQQLYSSPMRRCLQSGIMIYPENSAIIVDELREYDFGEFEGLNGEQLDNNEAYREWIAGKKPSPPGGEGNRDFAVRVCVGFRRVVEDMLSRGITNAAIITHGGVIMTLFDACALPRKRKFEWVSDSGRGYTVKITPSLYHSSGIIEVIDVI